MLKKLSIILSTLLFSAHIPTQALPLNNVISYFDYGYRIAVRPLL